MIRSRAALGLALPLAIVVAVAASGCSGGSSAGDAPAPLPTGNRVVPPKDAGGADTSTPPPPDGDASTFIDAGLPSRHFTGTLATTAATPFGGSPNCNYKVTLKQIDVDLTIGGNGDVASATVNALSVEEVVPPCPYAAQPANIHHYALASSSQLPSGALHVVLSPAATNQPQAALVLEGDFSSDNLTSSLAWHRTDIGAPLDWRVTAKVALDRN